MVLHLRAQNLEEGDEHQPTLSYGAWLALPFSAAAHTHVGNMIITFRSSNGRSAVELQSKGSRTAGESQSNRSRIVVVTIALGFIKKISHRQTWSVAWMLIAFDAFIRRTLNPVVLVYFDPDLPDGLLNSTAVALTNLANISAVLIEGHTAM